MNLVWGSGARKVQGLSAQTDLSFSIVEKPTAVGGSSGTQTTKDVTYNVQTGAGSANDFQILVSDSSAFPGYSVAVDSSATGICALDSSGNVTRLADGQAIINILANSGKRKISRPIALTGNTTVLTGVSSYATGSLLKYLWDQSNSVLAGVTPATVANQASQQWAGGAQTTNALLTAIAAGVDFSPYLNTTWVSTGHYVVAAHTRGVGRYSNYCTNLDGSPLVSAKPTTQVLIGGVQQAYGYYLEVLSGDLGVFYSPTPYAGTICKTLPSNWASYLPTFNNTARVPAWVNLGNMGYRLPGANGPWVCPMDMVSTWSFDQPVDTLRKSFHPGNVTGFIGGDSGSSMFMVINNQPVLLGHTNFGGLGAQLLYHQNVVAINQAMNDLSASYIADGGTDAANGTYALSAIDLSGFNTY